MSYDELFDTGRGNDEYRPRPYQCAAVSQIEETWAKTSARTTLSVMATGTGKTEVAAELIRRAADHGHGSLFIAPFIDLVSQTAARLRSRGVACGVEQGVLRSNNDVTVACYASLLSRRRWEQFVGRVKRVIVDEVHLNFTSASMRMLSAFVEDGCEVLGMTATPDRGGDPLLSWYGKVSFYYPYHAALEDSWLVPAKIWMTVLDDLDLSAFKRRHGDFDSEELGRIMAQEKAVQGIGSMIEQHHDGQPSVVFCQGIRQSEQLLRDLTRRGIAASIVHSKMGPERQMHLRDFEEGLTNVILNVGCLCTGWDSPKVSKVFIAKPTLSRSKYCQMFGRGVRPLPGIVDRFSTPADRKAAITSSEKPHFEVFDITDSSRLNDLRSAVDVIFPNEDAALLKRVRRRVEQAGGQADLDPILEQERAAEAAEQAARDALQEKLRRDLVAHGKFSNYERSVYAEAEQPSRRGRQWRQWSFMPFGKYKGKRFRDVPTEYLRWALREANLRGDLRTTVEHEVMGRAD